MQFHRLIQVCTTIAAAVLTGCGGGGGGGDGGGPVRLPATGDFDSSNYADVAASAVSSRMPANVFASTLFSALVQPSSGTGDRANALSGEPRRSALRATAQAVDQDTESCPGGGTLAYVVNDADNDDHISPGDTWLETYSDCGIDGLVLNGSTSVTVQRAALPTSIGIAISFDQLSFGSGTLHGDGTLAVSVNGTVSTATLGLRGMSLDVSGSETLTLWHTIVLSYDQSTGESRSALDGPVALGSGSYWFKQETDFTVPNGKHVPRSGTLVIVDKDGDRIQVVGTAQGLRYDFYKVGSTTPDATHPGVPAD